MELFAMLEEEDRKYMLKQILRNIECDMREKGIYAENKKEIDPRKYLGKGKEKAEEILLAKMKNVLFSAGKK